MRARIWVAIIGGALLLALTACGGKEPTAAKSPAASNPSPTASATVSPVVNANSPLYHFQKGLEALDAGDLAGAKQHVEEGHELAHDKGLDEASEQGDLALEELDKGDRAKAREHIVKAIEASTS